MVADDRKVVTVGDAHTVVSQNLDLIKDCFKRSLIEWSKDDTEATPDPGNYESNAFLVVHVAFDKGYQKVFIVEKDRIKYKDLTPDNILFGFVICFKHNDDEAWTFYKLGEPEYIFGYDTFDRVEMCGHGFKDIQL